MAGPLTVGELVAHLLTLPQDLPVLAYAAHEDYSRLTAEGVAVYADGEERWWSSAMLDHRDDAHVTIIGGL